MQRLIHPYNPPTAAPNLHMRKRMSRDVTSRAQGHTVAKSDLEFGTAWPQSQESFLILFGTYRIFQTYRNVKKKKVNEHHLDSPTHILPHMLSLYKCTHIV